MALSFLSGPAEMKSLEARILQNAARNKFLEAKKMESSMNEDFGLIGLDEISGKKKEKRQEKKAEKKEKRQEKKTQKKETRQEKKAQKKETRQEKKAQKKETRQEKKAVKVQKRQEKKAVKVQKRVEKKSGTQAKPAQREELDIQNDMIIPESRGLSPKEEAIENKITEARELQDEAIRVEQESKDAKVKKSGFNQNILLFGGLGAAALIGIYFLTKKK
jgi:hypothetical protein